MSRGRHEKRLESARASWSKHKDARVKNNLDWVKENKMATLKQKEAAKLIIKNATLDKPLTGGEIVENSGYGVSMKGNPQVILNSQGVKDALAEYGFSEDNAKMVVTDIMMNEETDPNTRLKATDQVFKVHGTYAAEKSVALNVNVAARSEDKSELDALREEYIEKLKQKLANETK